MARLITSGFESKTVLAGGVEGISTTFSANAAPAIVQTTVRSGTSSLQLSPSNGSTYVSYAFTGATATTYFARMYMYFSALPSSATAAVLSFYTGATHQASIRITTGGKAQLWNEIVTAAQVGSDSAVTITTGTWYRLELSININSAAGANDSIEAMLDGVSIAATTTATIGTAAPTEFRVGCVSGNGASTWFADDVALNDNSGSQNTWPGAGNVLLLLPTADSAVGTGWTLGTGTAISGNSGSTAVKNTPPLGVADLAAGSDVKQIRNASANANTSYDATMTTYTAAGIGASDTINVIVPVTSTAAPVTTSAKQGTVGVVSNPAITNVALGALGTAGAFWQGNAAAGYATGWKTSFGTATYAPSVTLGTAPVMRITQVTSSTRIAMVCFMGMYVDYTPAPVTQVPYVNPMPPFLAQ